MNVGIAKRILTKLGLTKLGLTKLGLTKLGLTKLGLTNLVLTKLVILQRVAFWLVLYALAVPLLAYAESQGNTTNDSFHQAKTSLEKIYADHRLTLYCAAVFDQHKRVTLPEGFVAKSHVARAQQIEWEHVVPAEQLGRAFIEWREGSPLCVDNRGKPFKGRPCAEKTNPLYRAMQADMYNLYPAIGAVNAARQNFSFALLPDVESSFGSCAVKIKNKRVEPPAKARGQIARTYKYMANAYASFRLSRQQQHLMDAWDRQYPVDTWECTRAKRIEHIQGNENPFVKKPCQRANLW